MKKEKRKKRREISIRNISVDVQKLTKKFFYALQVCERQKFSKESQKKIIVLVINC